MPPKNKIPAPIDRPLSRAYLREFTGWSTDMPPGISDPTSLRIMENVQIQRDGSLRVRPGLKYMTYDDNAGDTVALQRQMVGTHEPFFLNDGSKAYLFAVRELDDTVGFRVLSPVGTLGMTVRGLTEPDIDFDIPQGEAALAYRADCTYVKYLQIDNKIFALANNNQMMRVFSVGDAKSAKVLSTVTRPEWTVADKLSIIHPVSTWIAGNVPTATRMNKIFSPGFETGSLAWTFGALTAPYRSASAANNGTYSMRLGSKPERTNLMPVPLHNLPTAGYAGWLASTNVSSLSVSGGALRGSMPSGNAGEKGFIRAPKMVNLVAKTGYRFSYELASVSSISKVGVRIRWYTAAGADISYTDIDNASTAPGRRAVNVTSPTGADQAICYVYGVAADGSASSFSIKDVMFHDSDEATGPFNGDSGTNYFWTGAVNNSASVYHPPQNVWMETTTGSLTPGAVTFSSYQRASTVVRSCRTDVYWEGVNGAISTLTGTAANDTVGSFTRQVVAATAPAATNKARVRIYVLAVPRGEYHYIDSVMAEPGVSAAGAYFDGGTTSTTNYKRRWNGTVDNSTSIEDNFTGGTVPAAATKTANTLRSSTAASNTHNFGFFYVFFNEVGETPASRATTVRVQRAWAAWRWETANAAAEPSGTDTADPELCADQLVAAIPQVAFDAAIGQGAIGWRLYMFTWSDEEAVPVTAVQVGERPLTPTSTRDDVGWLKVTPQMINAGAQMAPLPQAPNPNQPIPNFTEPSKGTQGIVAADRMVLVNDPSPGNQAKIRWTSNQMGFYTDFSASRGGGYKTLTSGNLYIPACVKLWQNPQSTDTLTILCLGVDGTSTGYYMAPAQVAQQSDATNVMGFEETTATPGTTSPYGCEIFNNALYHPLDDMVMKSTATNYNINHKSITDPIQNMWKSLDQKIHIVSSIHDNRIYYLVYNPEGQPLEPGCWGNEVWVFDAQAEKGTWSRWLTQGHSLRKIEQGGRVSMSLCTPQGLFYFDELYDRDDYVDLTGHVQTRFIPWRMETNTQGANRAHDAWAHLQQANITLGNFQGRMRYGVRGWSENGKPVDISKVTEDLEPPIPEQFDVEDFLLVRRNLREWFLYAESVVDETGAVVQSYGQIDLVQYRYTPVSVNVGYEYGSVETFEYGRAEAGADGNTTNGVPVPYIETRRP